MNLFNLWKFVNQTSTKKLQHALSLNLPLLCSSNTTAIRASNSPICHSMGSIGSCLEKRKLKKFKSYWQALFPITEVGKSTSLYVRLIDKFIPSWEFTLPNFAHTNCIVCCAIIMVSNGKVNMSSICPYGVASVVGKVSSDAMQPTLTTNRTGTLHVDRCPISAQSDNCSQFAVSWSQSRILGNPFPINWLVAPTFCVQ